MPAPPRVQSQLTPEAQHGWDLHTLDIGSSVPSHVPAHCLPSPEIEFKMITFEQLSCANHRLILQVTTKSDTRITVKPQGMVIHPCKN